ncbi:MAG: bifunctional allantoicase/OHCU decarboxylase [Acidobacteria bacterium]|nr:bifunctional allantoicase/OHCU decarboxylase [Acidobacteriota bacterium]
MRLADLNAADDEAAVHAFLRCCGSPRWARQMAASRPFASVAAIERRADAVWWALDRADWVEAFAAHPKIGAGRAHGPASGGKAGGSAGAADANWSDQEQAGVAAAAGQTMRRLAVANGQYEARFGYIFIVCASGKTADEILVLLEARLRHDADEELRVAAEEQRRITRLRVNKLLEQEPDTIS